MSKKKLLTLALACIMLVTLAVPVFATGNNTPQFDPNSDLTTVVKALYQEVPISVSVPTSGDVVLNPLGMPVPVRELNGRGEYDLSGQIISYPMYITNMSKVDLSIKVEVTGSTQGGLIFSPSSISTSAAAKQAYVRLQVLSVPDDASDPNLLALTADGVDTANEIFDAVLPILADEAYWATESNSKGANVTACTVGVAKATINNAGVLKKATPYRAEASGGDISPGDVGSEEQLFAYNTGSIAIFRLTGVMASSPVTPWTAPVDGEGGDGFTATVVFSFTPVVA